ncbi:MAG: SOS response-associated peptidase family protein [Pyrinomonadaceae bacterium]
MTELVHINDRMPVMLHPESYSIWLSNDSKSAELRELLTPFPVEMVSHAVSYDVNHPKIDDEHLVTRVEPNLGLTGRLF